MASRTSATTIEKYSGKVIEVLELTENEMKKGFLYILECVDGSFYTGSTTDISLRMQQHQKGQGANHTKKRLPVKLVYLEEFTRIDVAFNREKQIQGWSRKKKEALINGKHELLPKHSMAYRDIIKDS